MRPEHGVALCRISVFTENGATKNRPDQAAEMLSALSQDPALLTVAQEVEDQTIQMVDEAS
jgi:hypothetical protein